LLAPYPDGTFIGMYEYFYTPENLDESKNALIKFDPSTGSIDWAYFYNGTVIAPYYIIVDSNKDILVAGYSKYVLLKISHLL
jgi:hypothetical protein